MSLGQAAHLDKSLLKAGATAADVHALCDSQNLTEIIKVLRGFATIEIRPEVIDCAAETWIDNSFGSRGARHTHQKDQIFWDVKNPDKGRWRISNRYGGPDLILFDFNEKVRDHFVNHPPAIPERWKKYRKVVFKATRKHSRAFMMGRPTYWYPAMSWDQKNDCWLRCRS